MKRTLWRGTAVYDDRRRTNLLMVQVSAIRFWKLLTPPHRSGQIFGAGGALIIQKKNKEKEKGKGKEERREKRKKERGEFNLEDPMFPI